MSSPLEHFSRTLRDVFLWCLLPLLPDTTLCTLIRTSKSFKGWIDHPDVWRILILRDHLKAHATTCDKSAYIGSRLEYSVSRPDFLLSQAFKHDCRLSISMLIKRFADWKIPDERKRTLGAKLLDECYFRYRTEKPLYLEYRNHLKAAIPEKIDHRIYM